MNRTWGYDTSGAVTQTIMPITDPAAISAATGVPVNDIPSNLYDGPFDSALLQVYPGGSSKAYTGKAVHRII